DYELTHQAKKLTEYPILLYGLVVEVLPVHFLSKNGIRRLLRAFGSAPASHFFHGVVYICLRRLLSDQVGGRSSFPTGLV
ncbi:MAG: hypothetical protein KC587_19435, partial [Nitrospira sp.]|nr:hypothetical protein [Nitrospira sp.]